MTTAHIDWEAVRGEAADLLSRYLRIDTSNPPGNETAGARFLADVLTREAIRCDIYEPVPGRGSCVTRRTGSGPGSAVLLLHHIDVVPAEAGSWRHDPFSGLVRDGEIWGRGAQDCKFLGIMELMAFILLKRQGRDPEQAFALAATADEEAGGAQGVAWLLEQHPQALATATVINEGVGWMFPMRPDSAFLCQVAEKGACWIEVTFQGRPGHGSLPHADNCLVHMARAVQALAAYSFPVCLTGPGAELVEALAPLQTAVPDAQFRALLGSDPCGALARLPAEAAEMLVPILRNTAVPTTLSGGVRNNVIPGTCHCDLDCRILPGTSPQDMLDQVQAVLDAAGVTGCTAVLRTGSPASVSPRDTVVYERLAQSFSTQAGGAALVPFISPGATDSRYFRARGIPAYGLQFDPTVAACRRIHGHDERIGADRLVLGTRVLHDLLAGML